ncbi:HSP20 family protein [Sinomicrobium oceani]|uniref:HSP20 family protein n=1 Tax=Sinomicrobium oceani TaxID=1150368 RepID=A0A1K1PPV9_9FLAO|nr:Hsp20/alpha crystallin family protein [Sinomicrobium oceani]SFW49556.1 HSP20 family protein [Sinomicrobium oceani]
MSLVKRNNDVWFPSIFDEFLKPDWLGGIQNQNTHVPAVNIQETDKEFTLELVAPGKHKEDFKIEVDDQVLTISSEQHEEKKEDHDKYTRREFRHYAFRRSFNLPDTIKDEAINAAYENGILKLTLPKREEALPKPKKFIEIS